MTVKISSRASNPPAPAQKQQAAADLRVPSEFSTLLETTSAFSRDSVLNQSHTRRFEDVSALAHASAPKKGEMESFEKETGLANIEHMEETQLHKTEGGPDYWPEPHGSGESIERSESQAKEGHFALARGTSRGSPSSLVVTKLDPVASAKTEMPHDTQKLSWSTMKSRADELRSQNRGFGKERAIDRPTRLWGRWINAYAARGGAQSIQIAVHALEHGLRLVVRAENLDDSEKTALQEALSSLLKEHGFKAHQIMLNGKTTAESGE